MNDMDKAVQRLCEAFGCSEDEARRVIKAAGSEFNLKKTLGPFATLRLALRELWTAVQNAQQRDRAALLRFMRCLGRRK